MKFEDIFFHVCDFCEFHIETYSPCFILQYCEIRLCIIQNLPLLQCLFQKFLFVFSHIWGRFQAFIFVSFWDIQVQTFPQISVCETKAWKWVDRLVFNIYIVKSFTAVIIYVQTLDQKIFMLSRRACWFEMQYYPHQTFPCWITITVKHSFLYYFSTM